MRSPTAKTFWLEVLAQVEGALGKGVVDLWLRQASLVDVHREEVTIAVSSALEREQVARPATCEAIASAFEKILGARPAVTVVVDAQLAAAQHPATHAQGLSPAGRPPPPPLQDGMTFDGFVPGASNRMARDAGELVCKSPGREYNPLVLCGGVGSGKTHLLMAIARRMREEDPTRNVVVTTAADFVEQYVYAIQEKTTHGFRARHREVDALLIDDLHRLWSKPATQEEVLHTFDTLLHGQKQIVITSEEEPRRLGNKIDERLANRLSAGLVVTIDLPDLETRRRIVEARARRLKLTLGREVVDFLARHVTRSVRDLCGALVRLAAQVAIGNRLDLALVRRCLGDLVGGEPALPPHQAIIQAVAEALHVDAAAIISGARRAEVARARQVAMALVRKLTTLSLKEIGALFGRQPGTVNFAEARVAELAAEDEGLRASIEAAERGFLERSR